MELALQRDVLLADRAEIGMIQEANELFLLLVVNALLNVPVNEVPKEFLVDEEIKEVLLGLPSRYRPICELVLDYESGTWEELANSARVVRPHENLLPDLYLRLAQWVTEVLDSVTVHA